MKSGVEHAPDTTQTRNRPGPPHTSPGHSCNEVGAAPDQGEGIVVVTPGLLGGDDDGGITNVGDGEFDGVLL
jgi:hypothetical protein